MGPDDPTGLPPEETHVEEVAEQAEPHCHRCGAPHDRFQEYCLECGARLTPLPSQFRRRELWTTTSGSPLWFWASLLALLVIALITAAVVIAATKDDEKGAVASSTAPTTVIPTGLTTLPLSSTTLSTVPTLPTTTTFPTTFATTTTPTTSTFPTTTSGGLTTWPSGKSGYTIILESVPESSGRSAAETKARAAQSKGLPEVGVLRTSDYKELTPGYYAVFSGVKDTQAQAESGVSQAKSQGYSSAYVREIVPK